MEDNLKRLVSETTRILREAGCTADPRVIAYMACLQDASHTWDGITGGAPLSAGPYEPSMIAALSKFLLGEVQKQDTPYFCTAAMQVLMEAAFKAQQNTVEGEQAERGENLGMLLRAVTGPKPLKDTSMESYEKFYKRVYEFVCVQSGMDRAINDTAAGDEVRVAMESVFPLSTLARFLTLGESERLAQVEELSRITLGICLYNRATGKGGLALPAATSAYLPQAQRLQRDIDRHIESSANDLSALAVLEAKAEPEAVEAVKLEEANRGQALVFFEQMREDLLAGLDATSQLEGEMQHCLLQVQDSIGGSSAVSKELIYPLFDRLGLLHGALNDELRLMVVRQRLCDDLVARSAGFTSVVPVSKGRNPPISASSPGLGAAPTHASEPPECGVPEGYEFVKGSGGPGAVPPGMALAGFCPVALATMEGAIRRFDPSLGFVRSVENGKMYGFASAQAVEMFCSEPTGIIAGIDAAISKQPLLAKLLGEAHQFPALDTLLVVAIMSGPLKVDFGSQTPTHFLERHIDHSYEWNEWALRRRAISLANLRTKATHSAQTALSHFKRDGETQVWQPKAAQVQTRVNKGQAMPKKLQYVAGLRGAASTKMNVIRLELDLGQPHQH